MAGGPEAYFSIMSSFLAHTVANRVVIAGAWTCTRYAWVGCYTFKQFRKVTVIVAPRGDIAIFSCALFCAGRRAHGVHRNNPPIPNQTTGTCPKKFDKDSF